VIARAARENGWGIVTTPDFDTFAKPGHPVIEVAYFRGATFEAGYRAADACTDLDTVLAWFTYEPAGTTITDTITDTSTTDSEGTETMSDYGTIIDSKDLGTQGGFDLRAILVPDTDTSPRDYGDMYEGEITAAWERDEWSYVGTVVIASRDGIDLGSDAIWGQEYGLWPGSGFVSPFDGEGDKLANGYGPQLIGEAIAFAQAKLEELAQP
jgi:hypothetical protein